VSYQISGDGTNIYLMLNDEILKIDPSDLSTVDSYSIPAGQGNAAPHVCSGGFLYSVDRDKTTPFYSTVRKIDTSDMTLDDSYTGDYGAISFTGVAVQDGYVYAGYYDDPAGAILKIDISDMTLDDTLDDFGVSGGGQNSFSANATHLLVLGYDDVAGFYLINLATFSSDYFYEDADLSAVVLV
jgi:hypothetical protein